MATRELESSIFGRDVSFEYSETWIGYSMLALRLVMGWTFFLPGIEHSWDPDWSARGLLLYGIPEGNPLTGLWTTMGSEWAWLLTPLNSLGLTLVGLALITGTFLRFSAFWGSVMMLFYWAAALPLENGFLVNYHIVYVLLLFGLGAFGAGRIVGIDAKLEQIDIIEKHPRLKLLLG
jgi:thiosulfate dehydrogenase [quinone] large subunit